MELVLTALYIYAIWLTWYKFKWLKVTLAWQIVWPSLWVIALSCELIALGQFCPYAREAFVSTYVYQVAPEYGGLVTKVEIKANQMVKQGDVLFQMDPKPWQDNVDEYTASLAQAQLDVKVMAADIEAAKADVARITSKLTISKAELAQYTEASKTNAISKLQLEQAQDKVQTETAELTIAQVTQQKAELAFNSMVDGEHTNVAIIKAELAKAQYTLESATVRAPDDGYAVAMNLQPGVELRMKTPVMSFVNGDEDKYFIVGRVPQFGMKRVGPGDKAEVMLEMYPAEVFEAEVVDVIWATGEAQLTTSGTIPGAQNFGAVHEGRHFYMVKLKLLQKPEGFQSRFGALGKAAIYPDSAPDALVFLRKLELRMDSWVSYLYR